MTLRFSMPWAPSVNTYWTHAVLGGKFKKARATVFLSEAGKRYRTQAILAIREQRIVARPPDKRTRDLDNLLKGSLDALRHAGVIADDGDIDSLQVERGPVVHRGELQVEIRELGVFNEQRGLDLPMPQMAADPF